jgi:DNA-binding NarL/FixJ family response regulator
VPRLPGLPRWSPPRPTTTFAPVARILIVADTDWVVEELSAALGDADTQIVELSEGAAVLPWVADNDVDLVILDFQIGNMGGIAICNEVRLEERAGRLDRVPVLILLDRRADVFLAKRVDAEGWLVKPLDPIRLRRAVSALLDGGTYFDASFAPNPVLAQAAGPGGGAAGAPAST